MEKIKKIVSAITSFINKNKTKIISLLGIALTLVTSLSTLDLGAKFGIIISILLVVIPLMISFFANGLNEDTIKLLVNAIKLIQNMINAQKALTTKDSPMSQNIKIASLYYNEKDIKEFLIKGE